MKKVKLELSKLNPQELIQIANAIKTAMTGNASFPTPSPALTAVSTAITTATSKVAEHVAAMNVAKTKLTERDNALDTLRLVLTQLAAYVESTALGDVSKIESAGMAVKAPPTPKGVPGTVQNLAATPGEEDGTLDLMWDPISNAKSYEVATSALGDPSGQWTLKASSPTSRFTLGSLTSGSRAWVRVRGINRAGQGAWSDPATRIVP